MLTLYGLNTATYKIALARCIWKFAESGITDVSMETLAKTFFDLYNERLENGMPQINHETRLTVMERTVIRYKGGVIDYDEAVSFTKDNAFNDVIPRFHNLDRLKLDHRFYHQTESGIVLTDDAFKLVEDSESPALLEELSARWSLLESAFAAKRENAKLINASNGSISCGAMSGPTLRT